MNKTLRNILIAAVVAALLILAARYLAINFNVVDLIKNMHG